MLRGLPSVSSVNLCACTSHQVQDFRRHALVVCEQAVSERANSTSSAMRYYYPPNLLDYQPRVDPSASEITVSVDYLSSDGTRYRSTIQVYVHVPFLHAPSIPVSSLRLPSTLTHSHCSLPTLCTTVTPLTALHHFSLSSTPCSPIVG